MASGVTLLMLLNTYNWCGLIVQRPLPSVAMDHNVAELAGDRAMAYVRPNKYDVIAKDSRLAYDLVDPVIAMDRAMLEMPRHCRFTLALDESQRKVDEDGRMVVRNTPISKAAVNPYLGTEIPGCKELGLNPTRIYYLLRPPEELKAAASSFIGQPFLDEHKPHSAKTHDGNLVIGSVVGQPHFEDPYLLADVAIWPERAIDDVASNKRKEISASYHYTPVMTPGIWRGIPYDGIMTNLTGNHIALVRNGRAGSDVAVADSGDEMFWTRIALDRDLSI
jgi:hypothetical protein